MSSPIRLLQFFQGVAGPCVAMQLRTPTLRGWAIFDGQSIICDIKLNQDARTRLQGYANKLVQQCIIHSMSFHGTVLTDGKGHYKVRPGPPSEHEAPVPYVGDPTIMTVAAAASG